MPRQLGFLILLCVGTLLAGGIFYEFYSVLVTIEAASTGFNASSRGLFGWDYSFAEHSFEPDGDEYRPVLVASGREIHTGKLVTEIIFCLGIGLGTTLGIWVLARELRTKTGEHAGDGKPDPVSS